jgi:hypothetical protein
MPGRNLMMAVRRSVVGQLDFLDNLPFDSCNDCKRDLLKADPFVVLGTGRLLCIWCYDKYVIFINNGGLRAATKETKNGEKDEA